jgi:putative endonuclease
MIWIYALSSQTRNYIYVGMTSNLERRIKEHNSGKERTTRAYRPFKLLYTEQCKDRILGRKREKYWKSGVGKEKLRQLRLKHN